MVRSPPKSSFLGQFFRLPASNVPRGTAMQSTAGSALQSLMSSELSCSKTDFERKIGRLMDETFMKSDEL